MKTVAARKKAGPFLYERWFEGGGAVYDCDFMTISAHSKVFKIEAVKQVF